ncbi:MAG: hypothetical protein CM15mP89_5320 [Gammaproteobacteria bacterium]|nr:MAG: hypothetical protein CM15mP89_5320 [Gammaproteobacteria bacterium]
MPIVDDPYDLVASAATNAISDIYAMGAPSTAVAFWDGQSTSWHPRSQSGSTRWSRLRALGFPLAGGHSIDAPDPFLASPLPDCGASASQANRLPALTTLDFDQTARDWHSHHRRETGQIARRHRGLATELMCQSNVGALLAKLDGAALTDVTGFGLGHLMEMCGEKPLCHHRPAAIPSYRAR